MIFVDLLSLPVCVRVGGFGRIHDDSSVRLGHENSWGFRSNGYPKQFCNEGDERIVLSFAVDDLKFLQFGFKVVHQDGVVEFSEEILLGGILEKTRIGNQEEADFTSLAVAVDSLAVGFLLLAGLHLLGEIKNKNDLSIVVSNRLYSIDLRK